MEETPVGKKHDVTDSLSHAVVLENGGCLNLLSMHCVGEVSLPRGSDLPGRVSSPGGLLARGRRVFLPGGLPCQGGLPCRGDLSCQGGLPCQGGSALPGVVSQHAMGQTPLGDRMTDTCKNVTFANYVCGR